jgi:DNA-binding protein HU-beta
MHETARFSLAREKKRMVPISRGEAVNQGWGEPSRRHYDLQEDAEMSGKRLTKAQVIAEISELSELDKKSVSRVFDGLTELIKKQLSSRGPGEFVIPGLLKLKAVKKAATKDRPGINPFTKQAITIKGKPASKKIRASALKSLKDLIQ